MEKNKSFCTEKLFEKSVFFIVNVMIRFEINNIIIWIFEANFKVNKNLCFFGCFYLVVCFFIFLFDSIFFIINSRYVHRMSTHTACFKWNKQEPKQSKVFPSIRIIYPSRLIHHHSQWTYRNIIHSNVPFSSVLFLFVP